MAYTVKDVLEKLIEIEKDMSSVYYNLSKTNNGKFESFKVLAKVMGKEEEKHSLYFKKIADNIGKNENIEIDFFTYDKISQRIYEFKNRINVPEVDKINNLIGFIMNFEKENLALLLDLRGKLIKNSEDDQKYNYKILSLLVNDEKKHVKDLESYCR